jgi:hypothetical protein
LAFSTIQGSGGAPDSFVGTSGVDAIVIVNSDGNYFLGAEEANDIISLQSTTAPLYGGVVSNTTLRGGQGADSFAFGGVAATTYVSTWVNGNADRDVITTNAATQFFTSTIHGGAANDTITVDSALSASLVNGNKGVDTINVTGALSTSSVFGGGGNDLITTGSVGSATDSVISGDLGNDTITVASTTDADGSSIFGGQGVDTIVATNFGVNGDVVVINGNEDADTITGSSKAGGSIFGGSGSDTITSQAIDGGAGVEVTTITGGTGSDTINLNGERQFVNYTAIGDGGAAGSATSTSTAAAGDLITSFDENNDRINFQAASLSGVGAAAVAAGAWDMDATGVYLSGVGALADTKYSTLGARVGAVTGDAGDTGYYFAQTAAGAYTVIQVTLGTDKTNQGLNAGDTVALLGTVTAGAPGLTTANISFLG